MKGETGRIGSEAVRYACEMSNRCVATSLNQAIFPFELLHGRPLSTIP